MDWHFWRCGWKQTKKQRWRKAQGLLWNAKKRGENGKNEWMALVLGLERRLVWLADWWFFPLNCTFFFFSFLGIFHFRLSKLLLLVMVVVICCSLLNLSMPKAGSNWRCRRICNWRMWIVSLSKIIKMVFILNKIGYLTVICLSR